MSFSSSGNSLPGSLGLSHSCHHCQKIILSSVRDERIEDESSSWKTCSSLSVTLADLVLAQDEGCEFVRSVMKQRDFPEVPDPNKVVLYTKIGWHASDGFADSMGPFEFRDTDSGAPTTRSGAFGGFYALFTPTGTNSARRVSLAFKYYEHTLLMCMCALENPASVHIRTRPLNPEPFSEESLQLYQDWFEECVASHGSCRGFTSDFQGMPTRLIEIMGTSHKELTARLQVSPIQPAPYAALSYCWGRGRDITLKTTKELLASWSACLPMDDIPLTIEDAMVVTHKLGIRYLWVDALCIVQDDDNDKTTEIARMPQIYSQADVTIVASVARSVQEGFLNRRAFQDHCVFFTLPFRNKNGELGSAQVSDDVLVNNVEPLEERGWALQELLMSRRVLEFTSKQTRFWCKENPVGLCDGWTPYKEYRLNRPPNLPAEVLFPDRPDQVLSQSVLQHKLISDWCNLVQHYTERSLTITTDRALAISGLANRFADAMTGKYLAGHWDSSLPESLLWTLIHDSGLQNRPPIYHGPSWSWTAAISQVEFWNHGGRNSSPITWNWKAEVVGVDISLHNDSAKFGSLRRGALTLRSRARIAEWKQESCVDRSYVYYGRLRLPGIEGPEGFLALRVKQDARESGLRSFMNTWERVVLLLVLGSPSEIVSDVEYCGLILSEKKDGTYSRLGVFSFVHEYDEFKCMGETEELWRSRFSFQSRWFDDCEVMSVSII